MHNLRKLLSEPYSNLKPRISDFKAFNILYNLNTKLHYCVKQQAALLQGLQGDYIAFRIFCGLAPVIKPRVTLCHSGNYFARNIFQMSEKLGGLLLTTRSISTQAGLRVNL